MRALAVSRTSKLSGGLRALALSSLLACALAQPALAVESSVASEAPLLASLMGSGAGHVSVAVSLEDDPEPVVGSFTVDGMTFAVVGDGEACLVSVGSSWAEGLLAGSTGAPSGEDSGSGVPTSPSPSPEGASSDEDGLRALSVPESVEHDGTTYVVASVGPRALVGCDADVVVLPASVASVDELAFRGSAVAAVEVADGNPHYSSYDGMLFDADQSSLLLIPEGKQGAALIPQTAESVPPSAFSHCALVMSISVDEGSAAYSSRNGCLYNFDGTQLLRVPAGSKCLTIAPECTSIERGALYGCTFLKTVMAEDVVEAIHSQALPCEAGAANVAEEGESDGDLRLEEDNRASEAVMLAFDEGAALAFDPASVTVVLMGGDANATVWKDAGFEHVMMRSALTDEEVDKLVEFAGDTEGSACVAEGTPLGSPIEEGGEPATPFDVDSAVIPGDVSVPIMSPSDNEGAPADADSEGGTNSEEGDVDSTASPSELVGSPVEVVLQGATTYAANLPSRFVLFDANGGVEGRVPDTVWTAPDGSMPSIENQCTYAKTPVRDKYAFMGFYDGSDYRSATRYYNPDFTSTGCATQYPFATDGLKLYAGWAPVISVDVPTSVSLTVGSLSDVDAPTKTTALMKNMSPWDVRATSLTWDITSLQGSTAELSEMFGNLSSLRFSLSLTDDPEKEALVAPGGTTTQAADVGFIELPKGSTASPSIRSFDYTMRMNEATVEKTEAVSSTSLIAVFEAADAPVEPVRSTVVFDINDDGKSGYYLDPVQLAKGEMPAPLVMPESGDMFVAPEYYGHTFMGFYDRPVYEEEGAVRYFDEKGEATRIWDKASASVLYAGWKTEAGKVVFDGNGGYFDGVPSKTQLVYPITYGSDVASVLGEGFVPKAMYRIGGKMVSTDAWYTDPIGGMRVSDFSTVLVDDIDEPIIFYAHWDASDATVPITFVANGLNAKVDGEDRITKDIKLGEFATSLPDAVRPGFTFAGWWTQAQGGVHIETAPPTLAALTLYAHWIGDEITVSWRTGGWDVPSPPSTTYIFTDTDTINTGYPSGGVYDAMDRGPGFAWNGWYAKADDGMPSGDRITSASPLPTESVTYHAFWDVDLTWNMNDGADRRTTTEVTLSVSAPVVMPEEPVRAGYAFDGWYSSAQGGTEVTSATFVDGPSTFYAHWIGNDYTVSIDKNANDATAGTASVKVKQGDMLPTLDELPVREGYVLVGFFDTQAGQGGTQYYTASGKAIRAWDKAGNGTLYARWVNESTGGTTPTNPPAPVDPGEVDPTDPFDPEDVYPKPDEKPSILVTPDSGSAINAKAVDEANVAKTLLSGTYHGYIEWNGTGSAPAASDTVVIALSAYVPSEGNAFEKVENRFASNDGKYLIGFTAPSCGSFVSWSAMKSGGPFMLKVKGSDLAIMTGLPSVTLVDGALKAVYADAPYKPVEPPTNPPTLEPGSGVANSFNANGGTFSNGAGSIMVPAVVGESLAVPSMNPARSGFDFDGWYDAKDGGNKITNATRTPNRATTYYAHWKGASFEVILDANAAEVDRYPTKVEVRYGSAMPVVTAGMPYRSGYTFVGFFDTGAATGGRQYYTASGGSARTWDKAENATLYARWVDNETGGIEGGEGPFPPEPVSGPTTKVTPQDGSAIKAEAVDGANVSRTLFDGTYHGSVTWEGTGGSPLPSERAVIRVDSYAASSAAPLDAALASFDMEGKYLLGFQALSTGSFVAASDICSGSSFELHVMGSDLVDTVIPSVSLRQGVLHAVYSDIPVNPGPGPAEPGTAVAITYDALQGVFSDGTRFAVLPSVVGEALSKPVNPVRSGYSFDGWFTLAQGGVGAPSKTPVANTTYYAHWSARSYTITFDKNGGLGGTDSAQATYDSPLPSGIAMPSRAGYTFAGYFDTKGATGGKLYYRSSGTGTRVYDIAEDATFYARWIDDSTGGVPGEPGTDPFPDIDPDDPQPGQGPTIKTTPDAGSSIAADASNAQSIASKNETLFEGVYHGSVMWGSDAEDAPKASDDVVVTVDAYVPFAGNDMASVAKRFETDGKWLLGFQVTSTGSFIPWDALRANTSFSFVMKGADLDGSVTAPDLSVANGTLRAVFTSTAPGTGGNTEVVNTFDAGLGVFASGNRFEVRSSIAGGTLSFPSESPKREGYDFVGWYTASVGGDRVDVVPAPSAPAASTTYYAHWRGDALALSWDGGSKPADAASELASETVSGLPAISTIERGTRLSSVYPDGLPVPTLKHCRFDGWYTSAIGGSPVSTRTIVTESVTYYAHWTFMPNPTTVIFDATTNGGAGGPGALQIGYREDMPAITDKPAKTGHTFVGFYDAASGGRMYYDGSLSAVVAKWDKLDTAVTLYAQFAANTYTVSFDANEGFGDVPSVTATYGQVIPTPSGYAAPTRTGYALSGWYDTSAATGGVKYVNADGTSNRNWDRAGNATLYARWTANVYTVIFDKQSGTGGSNVASATYDAALPSVTPPARAGYTFGGYWTGADGTGKQYYTATGASANKWAEASDKVLYAKWTANVITLTWDSQGGSAVASTTQVYSESAKLTLPASNPTKTGHAFVGWFTAVDDGTQVSASTSLPSDSTTYHAHWTANAYAIAFDGNGATSGSTASMSMTYGTAKALTSNGFVRTGHTFNGWNTKADGTGANYSNGQSVSNLATTAGATVTLYAKWTANTYAIAFNGNGATSGSTTSMSMTYGTAKALTSNGFVRTGHTFNGWNTKADGTGANYSNGQSVSNLATTAGATVTLYAKWTAKTSALTFHLNGGTGTAPTGKTAIYGSAMPSIGGAPTRPGYKFLGYYDGTGSAATQYYTAALASARNWNKDTTSGTTLYAHWEASYTPTPSVPSGTDGDFYLYLTSAQASTVSSSKLTMQAGYYGATRIKEAATDIASSGTSSIYYEVYQKIMNNDIRFKAKWRDAKSNNHNMDGILTTATIYDVRIIGLRQDYTNTAKTTFAGITFQFADKALARGYRYNWGATNAGGWRDSELRARMNSGNSTDCSPQPSPSDHLLSTSRQTIWSRAPVGITSNIQPVYKYTNNAEGRNTSAAAVTATRDQMFVASHYEMVSTKIAFDSSEYPFMAQETVSGTQYQFWKAKNVSGLAGTTNSLMSMYHYDSSNRWVKGPWWQRTIYPGRNNDCLRVNSQGNPNYGGHAGMDASGGNAVVPCFCF